MPRQAKNTRSIIVFDASNFYFKLKTLRLSGKSNFDYLRFSNFAAKDTQLMEMYYAVGKIEAKAADLHAKEMMSKQQEMIRKLRQDGFVTQYGYLLKSAGKFHEKGVDVQLPATTGQAHSIHIFFWPQLLQYLGFIMLLGGGWWLWRRR